MMLFKLRWTLVLPIFFCLQYFCAFAADNSQGECPAPNPINEHLINPAGLRAYIMGNSLKVKTVEDLVCCLPETYRQRLFISPASISGQNADLKNPRILMASPVLSRPPPLDSQKGNLDPYAIFTINGGARYLHNNQNVELMFDNRSTGEVEFYDIEQINDGLKMSQKNPVDECIVCHGKQGKLTIGGPHPNFEPLGMWSRFVNGVTVPCPKEKEYLSELKSATLSSLESNLRYRCLRPSTGHTIADNFDLINLDQHLSDLNARRTAAVLRSTFDYQRYKYVLIGALMCLQSGSLPRGQEDLQDIEKWLPPKIISQLDNKDFLEARVASSDNLQTTYRTAVAEEKRKFSEIQHLG